ncbi:MAG: DUF4968 domain-containing protein [Chitinophagales bacterium]|nr:DUF4968 domain-containing protein [Chitinophagales bacterium]HNI44002.1 glycoside hydrolase family 31 protein [Chitinophagales bacterium]HNL06512.1 glycoside hydrolase family 31 protein [Chitinophagales bacterium]
MKNLPQPIGKLQTHNLRPTGFDFTTKHAHITITFYSPSIVQIRIGRQELSTAFSYALVAQPQNVAFRLHQTAEAWFIYTDQMCLKMHTDPMRFELYDLAGNLLNADEPKLGTNWIGTEITTYKQRQTNERFVGLGEKTGNLDRSGSAYTHWNTDFFAYPTNADPIYCSTPFYIGIHDKGCYGIFLDNSHRSYFNFGASNKRFTSFGVEDGEMNYFLFGGNSIRQIIEDYTWLTGRMSLPPLWSLGLQQCRYSYYPDTEVLCVAQTFREKDIPADVMYLDIHYMDRYRVFTWHKQYFPQPEQLLNDLQEIGFNTVVILDPGICCTATDYPVLDDGIANDVFVRYNDGENYSADVWPGTCFFPDFTRPETRQWWAKHLQTNIQQGIKGFWNDMNEPATWGQFMPNNLLFDYDEHPTTHREARNVYGMQMARSTYEATLQADKGERYFVLTRAGFAGIQRYSAVWTGDNVASDEHFLAGVRLLNSMGLTGIAFSGYDVGGFCGEASPELFARWIAVAAFSPFLRCHSMINSRSAEPWAFGEEATEIARNYVKLRYRLLPYLYSLFYEATQNGMPIVRSLCIDHPHDPHIYDPAYQNQYYFGQFFLVAPTISQQNITKVYLPDAQYYDLYTDTPHSEAFLKHDSPKERLPVFVKSGAIVPMQSVVQHTQEKPDTTLEIHLYYAAPDQTDSAFEYYEDDGRNIDTHQHYRRTYTYAPVQQQLHIAAAQKQGYSSHFTHIRLFLHGFEQLRNTLSINQKSYATEHNDYRFIQPLSDFDPFVPAGEAALCTIQKLPSVLFEHLDTEIWVSLNAR